MYPDQRYFENIYRQNQNKIIISNSYLFLKLTVRLAGVPY